eukprot:gene542-1953_t
MDPSGPTVLQKPVSCIDVAQGTAGYHSAVPAMTKSNAMGGGVSSIPAPIIGRNTKGMPALPAKAVGGIVNGMPAPIIGKSTKGMPPLPAKAVGKSANGMPAPIIGKSKKGMPPLSNAMGKSAKRKAAEVTLANRYSPASSISSTSGRAPLFVGKAGAKLSTGAPSKRKEAASPKQTRDLSTTATIPSSSVPLSVKPTSTVLVKPCPPSCSCRHGTGWCHFPVSIPSTNWRSVFDDSPSLYRSFIIAKGYEKVGMVVASCIPSTNWRSVFDNWRSVFDDSAALYRSFIIDKGYEQIITSHGLEIYIVENASFMEDALSTKMPIITSHGLEIYIVENASFMEDAISKLRESMQDRVLAIDLEWRPENFSSTFSPVAMMQLSSGTVAVLIRTSSMGFKLPAPALQIIQDPNVTIVGFGWDGADEEKLTRSFNIGKDMLTPSFFDLQSIAHGLGYHKFSLARLTTSVMGFPMLKSKSVSRSNWAAKKLNMSQIKYAALDVFSAGQVFRGLRLWHSSPSSCDSCKQLLGVAVNDGMDMKCGSCNTTVHDFGSYRTHCLGKGHPMIFSSCLSCGRISPTQGNGGASAAGTGTAAADIGTAAAATETAAPVEVPNGSSKSVPEKEVKTHRQNVVAKGMLLSKQPPWKKAKVS